jgi:hypothetical protein
MSFVLNILWVIFGGGLVLWLEYMLAGLLLCLTIVGIPFGLQCFKIAGLALWPFGKELAPPPGHHRDPLRAPAPQARPLGLRPLRPAWPGAPLISPQASDDISTSTE